MASDDFKSDVQALQAEMNKLMGQVQGGLLKNPNDAEIQGFGYSYGPWYQATSQQNTMFLGSGPTAATMEAHEQHKKDFWKFYADWSAIMDKRGQGMKKLPWAGGNGSLFKWALGLYIASRFL